MVCGATVWLLSLESGGIQCLDVITDGSRKRSPQPRILHSMSPSIYQAALCVLRIVDIKAAGMGCASTTDGEEPSLVYGMPVAEVVRRHLLVDFTSLAIFIPYLSNIFFFPDKISLLSRTDMSHMNAVPPNKIKTFPWV